MGALRFQIPMQFPVSTFSASFMCLKIVSSQLLCHAFMLTAVFPTMTVNNTNPLECKHKIKCFLLLPWTKVFTHSNRELTNIVRLRKRHSNNGNEKFSKSNKKAPWKSHQQTLSKGGRGKKTGEEPEH